MFNKYKEHHGPMKVRTRKPSEQGAIFDSIFGESKVDKVISKYFEPTQQEINENIQKKNNVKKTMSTVTKMTETKEQELASKKFLEENKGSKFIGKTNKKNLVFENKGVRIKISPEGFVL